MLSSSTIVLASVFEIADSSSHNSCAITAHSFTSQASSVASLSTAVPIREDRIPALERRDQSMSYCCSSTSFYFAKSKIVAVATSLFVCVASSFAVVDLVVFPIVVVLARDAAGIIRSLR